MIRSLIVLVCVVAVTACNPSVAPGKGACTTDADCAAGTVCDTALGLCVKDEVQLCDKACGDGFLCVKETDGDRCRVAPGQEGTAAIRVPVSGVAVKGGAVRIACEAKGPQFRAVRVTVTSPGGAPTVLDESRVGATDEFEASWNADGATEGAYALGCALEYGPEGETVTITSSPVEVVVDKTVPNITHTAPTQWVKVATTELRATVKDAGTRASGVATAKLVFATTPPTEFTGVLGTNDEYVFAADLSLLGVEEDDVDYEVVATDRAGNEARTSGTLKVDGKGAVATPVADATWHRRTGTIRVTSGVTATGAPVASAQVRKGDKSWPGTRAGAEWTFDVAATDLLSAGEESAVEVSVVVVDEAGNETSAATTIRVDDKGPSVDIQETEDWVNGGQTPVTVLLTDGGAGTTGATVSWKVGAQTGTCTTISNVSGGYQCVVPLTTASGSVNPAYAFEVSASDVLTNATTQNGSLKVDKKGPTEVSPAVDGKWYRRGETVTVRLRVSDENSGVLGAQVPKFETTAPNSSTTGAIDAEGNVSFQVPTASISTAGATTGAIAVTIRVFDRIGNELTITTNSLLRVDDEKPTVGTPTVAYAATRTNALRRDPAGSGRDRVTVTVAATDPHSGSGVTKDSIKLAYPKKGGGTERIGPTNEASPWTFAVDVATAEFNQGVGPLQATVEAGDLAGNQAAAVNVNVAVTRELWSYAEGPSSPIVGGVALAGGKVFALHRANGPDIVKDNLHAINASSGAKVWSAKVAGTPTTPPSIGAQHAYFAYVGAGSKTWVAKYPISPSGAPADAWTCNAAASGLGGVTGALAIANWAIDDGGAVEEAVVAVNGAGKIWAVRGNCDTSRSATPSPFNGTSTAVAVGGTRSWFGGAGGLVASVNYETGGFAGVGVGDVGNGAVAGVSLKSVSAGVVSSEGGIDEVSTLPASTSRLANSTATFSSLASPVVGVSGATFFGTDDGYLFRAPGTAGFPVAMHGTPKEKVKGSPVLDADERAYVMTEDGHLRAISPTGTHLWAFDTGGAGVTSQSPALTCDGILYVGTSDGRVLALLADAPLATSPWPKFQHDNRNTGNLTTPLCD